MVKLVIFILGHNYPKIPTYGQVCILYTWPQLPQNTYLWPSIACFNSLLISGISSNISIFYDY